MCAACSVLTPRRVQVCLHAPPALHHPAGVLPRLHRQLPEPRLPAGGAAGRPAPSICRTRSRRHDSHEHRYALAILRLVGFCDFTEDAYHKCNALYIFGVRV